MKNSMQLQVYLIVRRAINCRVAGGGASVLFPPLLPLLLLPSADKRRKKKLAILSARARARAYPVPAGRPLHFESASTEKRVYLMMRGRKEPRFELYSQHGGAVWSLSKNRI